MEGEARPRAVADEALARFVVVSFNPHRRLDVEPVELRGERPVLLPLEAGVAIVRRGRAPAIERGKRAAAEREVGAGVEGAALHPLVAAIFCGTRVEQPVLAAPEDDGEVLVITTDGKGAAASTASASRLARASPPGGAGQRLPGREAVGAPDPPAAPVVEARETDGQLNLPGIASARSAPTEAARTARSASSWSLSTSASGTQAGGDGWRQSRVTGAWPAAPRCRTAGSFGAALRGNSGTRGGGG